MQYHVIEYFAYDIKTLYQNLIKIFAHYFSINNVIHISRHNVMQLASLLTVPFPAIGSTKREGAPRRS